MAKSVKPGATGRYINLNDLSIKQKRVSPKTPTKPVARLVDKEPKGKSLAEVKPKVYTREEKIAYCNRKYGYGNWEFMSREEVLENLRIDLR